MAARKKAVAAAGLPRGTAKRVGPRSGYVKTLLSLSPEQLMALREEAIRRSRNDGTLRPEVSAIVREAITAWLNRSR